MLSRLIAPALLGLLLAQPGSPAQAAAAVEVRVLTRQGQPAADVVVSLTPSKAWSPRPAPEEVRIDQRDIRFVPFVTAVPAGTTLHFVNRDRYDHHVRSLPGGPLGSEPPVMQFEFRLAGSRFGRDDAEHRLRAELAGTAVLGCHLHGSMRGHLFVAATPWVAVTGADGVARLPDVPEGHANLALWHPDQLVAQAAHQLQVAPGLRWEGRLNFSPRQRTPPSAAPLDDYPTR